MTGKMAINRIGSPAGTRQPPVCAPRPPAAPAAGIPPAKKRAKRPSQKRSSGPQKIQNSFPAARRKRPRRQKTGQAPARRQAAAPRLRGFPPPPRREWGALPASSPAKSAPGGLFRRISAARRERDSSVFPLPRPAQRRAAARGEKIPPAQSRRPGPGCSLRSLQPAQPAQPELPAQLEQSPQQRPRRRHAARSAAPTARRSRAVRNRSIGCIPSPPHSPSSSPA